MHPKVWEASGHVAGFTDPLVDCRVSKQRFRADQIFFCDGGGRRPDRGLCQRARERQDRAELQERAETFKRKKAIQGRLEPVQPRDMTEAEAGGDPAHPVAGHWRAGEPHPAARVQHDVRDQRRGPAATNRP